MSIICPYGVEHEDEDVKSVASFAKEADEDIDKAIIFTCPCKKTCTLKKALKTASFNQVEARVIRKGAWEMIEKCRAEEILNRPTAEHR